MRRFLTSPRYGPLQVLAGMLLIAFAAQSIWLLHRELPGKWNPDEAEAIRIREGWRQLHGRGIAGNPFAEASTPEEAKFDFQSSSSPDSPHHDIERSPLLYLISAAPLFALAPLNARMANYWQWLPRLPFLACGVLLGASLWYVSRRLCTNAGGLMALTLYCFSPAMIQAGALWHTQPEIIAVWGAFGTVFTSIAVAHTLYAPREVVLWNWRRIVLLGVSLALAVGSQFSMIVLVPIALAFLLYVAPVRRGAAVVIWIAACLVATFLTFATYFFHLRIFLAAMHRAVFWDATWRAFTVLPVYRHLVGEVARACPALALALPVALVAYTVWPRTRYFGNSAPLLVALLFLILGMAHPHAAGEGFLLGSVPFLILFVSGVAADLMETRYRALVAACICGMLISYAAWSILALAQAPGG